MTTGYAALAREMAHPAIRDHVVGLQPITDDGWVRPWVSIGPDSLDRAREAYDAGRVEMAQQRTVDHLGRMWMIQYAIPRKTLRTDFLEYFGTKRAA